MSAERERFIETGVQSGVTELWGVAGARGGAWGRGAANKKGGNNNDEKKML